MKILVACEFSGIVRDAFRKRGHDAWSCDLLPSEADGKWHLVGDVFDCLDNPTFGEPWDMLIAFPPCTYLTVAANKWMKPEYRDRFPQRLEQREAAVRFFTRLAAAGVDKICIENPIGVMSTRFRKPDQIIQPYQFGHPDRKPTCLWLKGLPPLRHGNVVVPMIKRNRNGKTASVHHDAALRLPPSERWKVRSRTYTGIAIAMAEQWG